MAEPQSSYGSSLYIECAARVLVGAIRGKVLVGAISKDGIPLAGEFLTGRRLESRWGGGLIMLMPADSESG